MIIFDLTLATRSPHLTGVERYGLNLFKAWDASPAGAIVSQRGAGLVPGAIVLKLPPMLAWLFAPFFVPKNAGAIIFPSFPPSPLFLFTRHILLRVIHDTVPWDHAGTMPWRGRLLFRHLETLFLRRYARVFCPTYVAMDGLKKHFPALATVLCGNAPGLDVAQPCMRRPARMPQGEKYLLAVGTLEPRKNYARLAELVSQSANRDLRLVIAGRDGWGGVGDALIRLMADGANIVWLPDLEDDELRWLYAHCAAFLTFSTAEGFNMPLVEAGWFGRPVLASSLPIHESVAPPWSVFAGLSASVEEFSERLAAALAAKPGEPAVKAYQERFSWSTIAQRIALSTDPKMASRIHDRQFA
jgi:glycosyltransferase involved in cell wall biosynthesis